MRKKLGIALLLLITLSTIGLITLIASVTWEQYQDTKAWQNTKLTGELKDIPPFLARNYVKAEDKEAVQAWQQVADSLQEIEQEQGIDPEKRDLYDQRLQLAVEKQTAYEITTGEIAENNANLQLYLDIETAMETAYESPQTKALQEVTTRLYGVYTEHPTTMHTVYFDQLRTIATDYANLSTFLTKTLPSLGVIDEQTLTVSTKVSEKTTKQIKTSIEEQNLTKFAYVQKLYELLTGSKWEAILKRNQVSREYQQWQAAKQELESLSKSQYYGASTIVTYQQALDAGLSVEIEEQEGYTIDPNSPVESILYQGEPVASNQYIRYGTPVVVQIMEQYIAIPKPETPKEEEPETKPDEETPTDPEEEKEPDEETPEEKPEEKPDPSPDEKPDAGTSEEKDPASGTVESLLKKYIKSDILILSYL